MCRVILANLVTVNKDFEAILGNLVALAFP